MPYRILILVLQLLTLCALSIIVIFLLPLAIPYIKNALSFKYIRIAMNIERDISLFVQNIIPTKISGSDWTRWIIIGASFLFWMSLNGFKERYRGKLANLKIKKDYEEWKANVDIPEDSKVIAPLSKKIDKLQTANKKDREELLKLFAETKKKLDSMGRDLAFLSIDVVDSTGLKQGEEKASIEYDFREYKNFVENKLRKNGVLKSAWTPDGVMSCFPTVDAAVNAAREVISGIDDFNRVKTMKRDFSVRCGINAGYVYFDDTLPLEEMSDRVIDIAGHMQKQALPNSICIAKPAIEPLEDRSGFFCTSKIVDGYEVYMSDRRKVPREAAQD